MNDTTKQQDPRSIPGGSTGYDSQATKYVNRGDGQADWHAAGSPYHDVKGRELDPAGWPTGKMMDGTDQGGTKPAPAFDPARFGEANGYHWDPEFDTVDAVHAFDFPVKAGGFVVSGVGGAGDGDVHFHVTRGDTVLASHTSLSFSTTEDETLKFTAYVNRDAVAVQNRVKAGEKAARASFNIYKA